MADKEAIPPPPEPHNTAPVLETENKEDDETTKEPAVVTVTEVEGGSSDEAAGDKLASPADLEVPSEPPLEVRQWFGRSVYWQVYVRRF